MADSSAPNTPTGENVHLEEVEEELGGDLNEEGQTGCALVLGDSRSPVRLHVEEARATILFLHGLEFHLAQLQLQVDRMEKEAARVGNVYTFRGQSTFGNWVSWSSSQCKSDEKRETYRAGLGPQTTQTNASRYHPHVTIKSRHIRGRLVQIAKDFVYLDRGFADYFQAARRSVDREYVVKFLQQAREDIEKQQPSTSAYVGDLGEFCEAVVSTWEWPEEDSNWSEFRARLRLDGDYIHYLQDALELPYWRFMINEFLDWKASNPKHLGADGILYVLKHVATTCRRRVRNLRMEVERMDSEDRDAVEIVIRGIEERVNLLESALIGNFSGLDDFDDDTPSRPKGVKVSEVFPGQLARQRTSTIVSKSQKEIVTLIGLVFGFLMLAIIPGYKGFAISWKNEEAGSIHDADFWYLCQSNVMSVLGSLVTAMPLLRRYGYERAHLIFWLFFTAAVLLALLSVILYPYCNTGWSALVAFLSSVASASSTLALTLATVQSVKNGDSSIKQGDKPKQD
ncbi:hypothetical protein F4779DRAFT_567599 [Xylariaceae sp. FL0662B]|nr:hypothetical protein F4779DRAFT_567599 [Xylariaceae sp. FL0662B]